MVIYISYIFEDIELFTFCAKAVPEYLLHSAILIKLHCRNAFVSNESLLSYCTYSFKHLLYLKERRLEVVAMFSVFISALLFFIPFEVPTYNRNKRKMVFLFLSS